MFILGNILIGLTHILDSICFIANIVIIASVVISWVNADPYNPIVRTINSLTQPVFSAVRRKIPTSYGAMDFTPIIVLLIIMFVQSGILPSVLQIGLSLKLS